MEETRSRKATFPRAERRDYGYDVKQVDAFMAKARRSYNNPDAGAPVTSKEVRAVAFDPAKGGYEPRAIDAALDRIEDAFAERERDALIAKHGEEQWLQGISKLSTVLRARMHRRRGERFRRPTSRNAISYDIEDVDRLCEELLSYFEKDKPLSVDVVRRAVFRPAKGRNGYDEAQVDAFLDRVVELMAAID